jgi:hypothetical protein
MRNNPLLAFAASALAVAVIVLYAMGSLAAFDACRIHLNDDHPARESLACHLYAALGVGSLVLFAAAAILLAIVGVAWLHRILTAPRRSS